MLPIEIVEARYPVRFRSHRLVRDAGGRGLHTGGPAAEKIIEILQPAFIDCGLDRTLDPAWGLAGGESGKPGEVALLAPGERDWKQLTKLSHVPVASGTVVRMRAGGGGGWGRPHPTLLP